MRSSADSKSETPIQEKGWDSHHPQRLQGFVTPQGQRAPQPRARTVHLASLPESSSPQPRSLNPAGASLPGGVGFCLCKSTVSSSLRSPTGLSPLSALEGGGGGGGGGSDQVGAISWSQPATGAQVPAWPLASCGIWGNLLNSRLSQRMLSTWNSAAFYLHIIF